MADDLDNLPPCEPGSAEWQRRVALFLKQEASQPFSWWYLSFCDDQGFLGAVIVRARGFISAGRVASDMGINPGGECRGNPLGRDAGVPAHLINRLLSMDDLKKEFGEDGMVRWD